MVQEQGISRGPVGAKTTQGRGPLCDRPWICTKWNYVYLMPGLMLGLLISECFNVLYNQDVA